MYRECSGETALLALFDKHQNMTYKACVCTLQIIVVNMIECSNILNLNILFSRRIENKCVKEGGKLIMS